MLAHLKINSRQTDSLNIRLLLYEMSVLPLLAGVIIGAVSAQDTYSCPDGWHISDIGDEIECILLSGVDERVTKSDAETICAFHEGWLVDMDEGRGPQKNNLIKSLISAVDPHVPQIPGMQYDDQWWIGATVHGPHGDHNYGNWTWDHTGTEITWYDWMRNEPNDWHGQNCLTFLKWGDPVGFGIYHWNDWDCNQLARFICERPGASMVEA